MTTPVPYVPGGVVQGEVVQPTAVASGKESAVHALGEVLMKMVDGIPAAFTREDDRLKAHAAIQQFVSRNVTQSGLQAIRTGDERAPIEDVALRVPPPPVTFGTPVNPSGGIDYDRLAAAIVRQQAKAAAQAALDAKDTETQ